MYGTTLCLPGDFFQASTLTDMVEDPLSYVDQLKATMQRLPPIPTRHHTSQNSYIPPALSSSQHEYIQHNTVKHSLQPPYDGPFLVLKRTPKHYTVKVNDQQQTVSINRLKPAFLEDPNPSQLSPTPFRSHCPLARQTDSLYCIVSKLNTGGGGGGCFSGHMDCLHALWLC